MIVAEPGALAPAHPLRNLRRQLGEGLEERPGLLAPRFDRYLDAVLRHCGFRIDAARGHLEAGFERLAEPLVRSGTLDARSFETLARTLDRAAADAHTLTDLLAAYRRAAADLATALQNPLPARRDRALGRAVEYMRKHYAEPLSSDRVARVAGFARPYFSRLFHQREGMTFEAYLKKLRIERAEQLLTDTSLSAARVAELSGFRSSQYFSHAFRKASGTTPIGYRMRRDKIAQHK